MSGLSPPSVSSVRGSVSLPEDAASRFCRFDLVHILTPRRGSGDEAENPTDETKPDTKRHRFLSSRAQNETGLLLAAACEAN